MTYGLVLHMTREWSATRLLVELNRKCMAAAKANATHCIIICYYYL